MMNTQGLLQARQRRTAIRAGYFPFSALLLVLSVLLFTSRARAQSRYARQVNQDYFQIYSFGHGSMETAPLMLPSYSSGYYEGRSGAEWVGRFYAPRPLYLRAYDTLPPSVYMPCPLYGGLGSSIWDWYP